jgi:hypothetical protein
MRAKASAIWLRLEFSMQTKSTRAVRLLPSGFGVVSNVMRVTCAPGVSSQALKLNASG